MWRAVIAAAVLLPVLIFTGKARKLKNIKAKLLLLLVLSGATMSFNWILLFEAYRYTSVAVATLCCYFAPTLMVIASALLFKERTDRKHVICFLASTAGLVMVIGVGGGMGDMRGVLFGLGAAVLYAATVIINKALGEIDGILRTFLQFAAASLCMLIYVSFTGGFGIGGLEGKGLLLLICVGAVHTGLTYSLYFAAVTALSGQQTAILSYIDPAVAVLVSVTVLGESPVPLQLAGGAVIIISSIINEIDIKSVKNNWEKKKDVH